MGVETPSTFSIYIDPINANCKILFGLQSTFAPASINIKLPFVEGIIGANAGLSIPFILPTLRREPARKAPVLPAERKASQTLSLTSFNPITIEESFFLFIAFTGISSFPITCFASTICSLDFLLFSFKCFSISSLRPTKNISISYSETASIQPSIIALGALSPPITSIASLIVFPPFA